MSGRNLSIVIMAIVWLLGQYSWGKQHYPNRQPPPLDHRVEYFEIHETHITDALIYPLGTANAWTNESNLGKVLPDPYGTRYPGRKNISVRVTSATVRGVLDALVAADTSYLWLYDNEVINLIPKRVDDGLVNPAKLEEVLPLFQVTRANMREAIASLVEQAKAQGITQLEGMERPQSSQETEGAFKEDEKITLSLKDKKIRECLNAIVAADTPSHWYAYPYKDHIYLMAAPVHSHQVKYRKLSEEELKELKKKYPIPYPKAKWIRGSELFGPPKEQEFGDPLTPDIKKQVDRYFREKEKSQRP